MEITRRNFLQSLSAAAIVPLPLYRNGEKIADAAWKQIGVTTRYEPRYATIAYPNGDVPRSEGICADVVVRACRDALSLDLQKYVHEDMARDFAAYPRKWGARRPDANIDHRRVLNLEVFFKRKDAAVWMASGRVAGDAFPRPLQAGDFVTWMLDGRLPHIAVIRDAGGRGEASVIHNIGNGVEETPLAAFHAHPASGHFRWPAV